MEDEFASGTKEVLKKYPEGSAVTEKEVMVTYLQNTPSPHKIDRLVSRALLLYIKNVTEGYWRGDIRDYIPIKIKDRGTAHYTQSHTIKFKTSNKGKKITFVPVGRFSREHIYLDKITNLKEIVSLFDAANKKST